MDRGFARLALLVAMRSTHKRGDAQGRSSSVIERRGWQRKCTIRCVARNHPEDEREARIDMILEELRINTEDLHVLTKQALKRTRQARLAARATVENVRRRRAASKAKKR